MPVSVFQWCKKGPIFPLYFQTCGWLNSTDKSSNHLEWRPFWSQLRLAMLRNSFVSLLVSTASSSHSRFPRSIVTLSQKHRKYMRKYFFLYSKIRAVATVQPSRPSKMQSYNEGEPAHILSRVTSLFPQRCSYSLVHFPRETNSLVNYGY